MQHVYFWNLGGLGHRWKLQAMFEYNVRFQVLCKTQEEYDLLFGYSLMFGQELELDTWEGWNKKRQMRQLQAHYDHSLMPLRLPPFVFTTWPDAKLRGL